MTIAAGILPFKLVLVDSRTDVTAHAGLPLVLEALRVAVGTKSPYRKLARALGYDSYEAVRRHLESLAILIASGGECLDDLNTLRGDEELGRLLGFVPPSPTQAKDFLYRFHQAEDGRALTGDDDDQLSVVGRAHIRQEGPGLRTLSDLMAPVLLAVQEHRTTPRVTLGVDATIIAAEKKGALNLTAQDNGTAPCSRKRDHPWVSIPSRASRVKGKFASLIAYGDP